MAIGTYTHNRHVQIEGNLLAGNRFCKRRTLLLRGKETLITQELRQKFA